MLTRLAQTLQDSDIREQPLAIGLTFHQLGLIICVVFSIYASLATLFLIVKHGLNYTQPREQRQIIRILFMIPIYSWISYLSFLFYHYSIYFQVIRDCYEALAIAAFFTLMCNYLAPSVHDQKDYFRAITPKNWILPINWFQKCTGGEYKGPFRKPAHGITWFNVRSAPHLALCAFSNALPAGHVDWRLPILRRSRLDDFHQSHHRGRGPVLRALS